MGAGFLGRGTAAVAPWRASWTRSSFSARSRRPRNSIWRRSAIRRTPHLGGFLLRGASRSDEKQRTGARWRRARCAGIMLARAHAHRAVSHVGGASALPAHRAHAALLRRAPAPGALRVGRAHSCSTQVAQAGGAHMRQLRSGCGVLISFRGGNSACSPIHDSTRCFEDSRQNCAAQRNSSFTHAGVWSHVCVRGNAGVRSTHGSYAV